MCSSIFDVFLARLDREALGDVGRESREIEPLLLHGDRGNFAAREVEQVVGELAHPRAFFEDHLQQLAALRIRLRRILAAQQLGRQRQRRERSAQFVRQRRDQVGSRSILIADIGHVLQNQQRAERFADGVMQRHWFQHVGMVAAANVKIDFGAMSVAAGALEHPQRVANTQVVRMVAAEIVERDCRARPAASTPRMNDAISLMCATIPSLNRSARRRLRGSR